MRSSYADYFGSREHTHPSTYVLPTTCAVCNFKLADDYGFCWIHRTDYVVNTYKPGRIDALPIKQEIRRRMVSRDFSVSVMAEVLGVEKRRLNRILSAKTVWLSLAVADFWVTKLELTVPEEMWAA